MFIFLLYYMINITIHYTSYYIMHYIILCYTILYRRRRLPPGEVPAAPAAAAALHETGKAAELLYKSY